MEEERYNLTMEQLIYIIQDVATSSEFAYTGYFNSDDVLIAIKRYNLTEEELSNE